MAFKLPPSSSPMLDALIYCGLKNKWVSIYTCTKMNVVFKVVDYDEFLMHAHTICTKDYNMNNKNFRYKELKEWFVDLPRRDMRLQNPIFFLTSKPSVTMLIYDKINRFTTLYTISDKNNKRMIDGNDFNGSVKRRRFNNYDEFHTYYHMKEGVIRERYIQKQREIYQRCLAELRVNYNEFITEAVGY